VFGGAIDFDGTDDHIRVADSASLDLGATGTVEAWVRLDRLGVWHGIVAKGNSNSVPAHNYALEVNKSNRAVCTIGNNASLSNTVTGSASLNLGATNHLACVWTGTQLRLYVNGNLNVQVNQTFTPTANTSPLFIGQYGGNADRTNGLVDEVRIYGRALSQAEVQSDMATPLP
jgi:Concanavalin A-like lectin/glucanases superfamily